jgi:hypothetical protein
MALLGVLLPCHGPSVGGASTVPDDGAQQVRCHQNSNLIGMRKKHSGGSIATQSAAVDSLHLVCTANCPPKCLAARAADAKARQPTVRGAAIGFGKPPAFKAAKRPIGAGLCICAWRRHDRDGMRSTSRARIVRRCLGTCRTLAQRLFRRQICIAPGSWRAGHAAESLQQTAMQPWSGRSKARSALPDRDRREMPTVYSVPYSRSPASPRPGTI